MASTARIKQTAEQKLEQSLLAELTALRLQQPACRTLQIAYSGGLDSTVLLVAVQRLLAADKALHAAFHLQAIHVNHGLSPQASRWEQHCRSVCAQLGIALSSHQVELAIDSGDSVEEKARLARYRVFSEHLHEDECLLMAHHRDDQLETFFLRLQRGAGVDGLAGMPHTRKLGKSQLWRPLLNLRRQELQAYAQALSLQWIEDESNADLRFDRNYLRQQLLPRVKDRWPGYGESWQRSMNLLAEASELLAELAAEDIGRVEQEKAVSLRVQALRTLSESRQRNLLRHWLLANAYPDPGWQVLCRVVKELIPAAETARTRINWQGWILQRYRELLIIRRELPLQSTRQALPVIDFTLAGQNEFALLPEGGLWQEIKLPDNGAVRLYKRLGQGLQMPRHSPLQLGYRQGGERCRLVGRRTRTLKKILQDAAIPPWLRERQPLLLHDGEIVAIPGIGVVDGQQAGAGEEGLECSWSSRNGLWTGGGSATL
ncbi:MAG: tRNA lysidine(34) synthetase TilS [Pseudomonadales bacterium]|nr:tRNA lysidine(34) synthetase TilS [Pseudomonadales bacterium]